MTATDPLVIKKIIVKVEKIKRKENYFFREKGMATHSSILAWRFPWTEEPGRLQSMGSKRVRHN